MASAQPSAARCPHCGAAVSGDTDRFCCHGCETAWAILHEAGLGAWYERREADGSRPEPTDGAWEALQPAPIDGVCEITLAVDGLRCASCTWVVEHLLQRTDGVRTARVSYATGRTRVTFDPARTSLRAVADRIASVGYRPRPVDAPPAQDDLLVRLGVASFCAANGMLLAAALYVGWFDGMEARYQALFRWVSLALATPVALWAAAPFHRGAWQGLRTGAIGMDVPISLAVSVLWAHGVGATLTGRDGYLDSLGMLVALLLAGRMLESRGRRAAVEAAAAIAAALPIVARRRTASGVEEVAVDALRVGDVVEVGAGQEIPADGSVIDGSADVQMALLTGEADPVPLRAGGEVVAGARILDGALGIRVARIGADTLALRMAEAVRASADRPVAADPLAGVAPWFTAAAVLASGLAGLAHGWLSGPDRAVEVAVAVLVVACPCALGLSVPLATAAGLGAVARRGVLLRDGASLLALADVETVALDKTGTVTGGRPVVLGCADDALAVAAGLDRASGHPIARALREEAARRGVPLALASDVREVPGVGVQGTVDGVPWTLASGGPGALRLESADGDVALIRLGDRPREDARDAIALLDRAGVRVVLLSGDHPEVTAGIAGAVGVREAHGGLTPSDKAAWIRRHPHVLFVGDGLNDGEALAAADVGLAMSTGVSSTLLAADGVVTRDALRPVVAALAGARAAKRAVRANVRRSVAYNVLAVGAAALGLVDPLVAAVLMPLSSGLVVAGALAVDRRLARLEARWTSC